MRRSRRRRSTTNRGATAQGSSLKAPRRGWCFPRPVQRFSDKLLSQQLWCWGRDILNADGNLLLRYGCERHRPDQSRRQSGSTCYCLDDGQRQIALWGFGLFYGERGLGGLYIGRFLFRPVWSAAEALSAGIHQPHDLPEFARPGGNRQWAQAHCLYRSMTEWIAGYECWVQRESGLDYRDRCVAEWLHPYVTAEQMPTAWRFLSDRLWETDPDGWKDSLQGLLVRPTPSVHSAGS